MFLIVPNKWIISRAHKSIKDWHRPEPLEYLMVNA